MKGTQWTKEQIKLLLDLARSGSTMDEAADRVGRSKKAITGMKRYLKTLGVDLPRFKRLNQPGKATVKNALIELGELQG